MLIFLVLYELFHLFIRLQITNHCQPNSGNMVLLSYGAYPSYYATYNNSLKLILFLFAVSWYVQSIP